MYPLCIRPCRTRPALVASLVAAGLTVFTGQAQAQAVAAGPAELVDALEGVFGKHPARRSGAKGVCATGFFMGYAEGRALTGSKIFSGAEIPVIARFSVGGGSPKASDKARSVRGLALKFTAPGESWEMANISAPVFFVNSPENFVKFLNARRPDPATGRPDPMRVKAFNDSHPDSKPQIEWLAKSPIPASYATVNYWGANAFEFTRPNGQKVFGKWVFEPARGTLGLTDEELKTKPDDFLVNDLRERVRTSGVAFNFRVQLAQAGDLVTDATVPLPADRPFVDLGRLVITDVDAGTAGACDKMIFNPLVLPRGVAPSKDPTLLARPGSYAVSLGRRLTP